MILFDFALLLVVQVTLASDDQKWVWGSSRSYKNYDNEPSAGSRYEVFEGDRPYPPEFTPVQRPGGVYGGNPPANYGQGGHQGVLTGPVPSWVQDGPIKDFDRCKCTEKFNCPSPGISYGHCDTGKQYCCYSTKGVPGGPIPSRPIHSPENGILVGPGGPFDRPGYGRPGSFNGRPGSFNGRPGSLNGRPGSFNGKPENFNGRPGGFNGNYDQRPSGFGIGGNGPNYENGILVGPGGPFDTPHYGRSSKPTSNN